MKGRRHIPKLSSIKIIKSTLKENFRETEYFIVDTAVMQNFIRSDTAVSYDTFSICLGISGSRNIKINGTVYTIDRNSVMITTPSTVIEVTSLSDNRYSVFFICHADFLARTGFYFLEEPIRRLFSSNNDPVFKINDEQSDSLQFLLTRLKELSNKQSEPFYYEMTQNYFIALLYELTEIYNITHAAKPIRLTRKEELVALFISLLSRQYSRKESLGFFAGLLGVNPKYLSETLKEITGKPAGTIMDEALIAEAKTLLTKPELTISNVAEKLHFSNQSVFGKFFKRYTGVAPTDYRTDGLKNG